MRLTLGRYLLAGLALASFLALGAGPGFAEVGEGDEAPVVEGKAFFNTEEVTFDKLHGRLIFLEFFATW